MTPADPMPELPPLLPCPFCRGTPRERRCWDESLYSHATVEYLAIVCDECDSESPSSENHDEVRAAWNRRTAAPAPAAVVCKRCGGAGVVDDGEIDCHPDGTPYSCGPVKCVKDCPVCRTAAPAAVGQDATDDTKRLDWIVQQTRKSGYAVQFRLLRDPAINAGINRFECSTSVGAGAHERAVEASSIRAAIDSAIAADSGKGAPT